jgi:hypothetical protein
MNFCATCGRPRTGDGRFCDGCGTEFRGAATAASPIAASPMAASGTPVADQPAAGFPADAEDAGATPSAAAQSGSPLADEPTRWDPPAEATRLGTAPADVVPADATRVERQPDATMIDTHGSAPGPSPAAPGTDPFASWFAADPPEGKAPPLNDPPGTWQQPAGPWQSADTMYAAPGQRPPAYPPPQPPPPYGPQQARPAGGQPSSGGKKAAFIIVVVLVMLAAGGGAYALVSRSNQHNTAQPPAPTVTASASGPAGAKASASASAAPSTSPAATASASASASAGVVSLGPGVASNPAEPAVEKTLTEYFQGINAHNYAEYASALDAQERAAEPESKFNSGYSSTSDSGMKLTSLASTGSGGLAATVTFTSHQSAGSGIDGSTCNHWTLTLYLVQQGAGYLQGAAPSGYQPTYSDC